jgi:hypothetical protein
MGLNVGGIYVQTDDASRVAEAIKAHWLQVGAKPLSAKQNPLKLQPLSLQESGQLGYLVCPAEPDEDGVTWVAVCDSERYHASDELAQALAHRLDTLVVIYRLSSAGDDALLKTYIGPTPQQSEIKSSTDWQTVEKTIDALPYGLLYYRSQVCRSLCSFLNRKLASWA